MILRLFFTVTVLLLLDVYAYQAVRSWVSPYSQRTRSWIKGIYWGLSALAFGALFLMGSGWLEGIPKSARTFVVVVLFLQWIAKLPVVLLLLVEDARRLAAWALNRFSPVTERDTSRSRFISKLALLAGGVPVATLTYGIVRNAYRYRRFAEDVPIPGLPAGLDGFKIVQISDMHSGSWTRTEPLYDAIELINAEGADVVCFTGDLVNSKADEMQPYVDIFKQVKAKHGVYSILGNHDYGDYVEWDSPAAKETNMERLYATHAALGWDLLRDENRILDINGHRLAIIGVENWGAAFRFPRKADLPKATKGTGDCDCRVLMSHDPTHWDAKVRPGYPEIDLTLSGHTHGFQFGVEIPGFRWSPAQYLYKQWAGLYREGKQFLYVNRGLGFLGYPGRVGILPEVTVLTLRRATEPVG